ncbi:hypothetical protein [Ruminococcus sp. FC2018]|uniref:hypothetical protein n=1 Tax=Ruminococcus sp. FC2018 TaxID=1410617 RepID=UPI000B19FBDC|nr:hypothetical protein [Ruminococcus sp. FC2018]
MKATVRYFTKTGNTKKLSDREFHCRGKFTALHSAHPDEADIAAVKTFARKVTGDNK